MILPYRAVCRCSLPLLIALMSVQYAEAQANPSPSKLTELETVKITGQSASDLQVRREFVAGKLIISRQSIADSGQPNVYELLKREPAVTVSATGRLGLLGLPGYTQVLVDGKPPLPGRDPMEQDLVHVERIEIVKGTMAEFGPFSIAGTINIVTRRAALKQSASVSLGGSMGDSAMNARAAYASTIRPQDGQWTLSNRISLNRKEADVHRLTLTESASAAGMLVPVDNAQSTSHETQSQLSANSSYTYKWPADRQFETTPSLLLWRTGDMVDERHQWLAGQPLPPEAQTLSGGRLTSLALPMAWKQSPEEGFQAEIYYEPSWTRLQRHSTRTDLADVSPTAAAAPAIRVSQLRSQLRVDSVRLDASRSFHEAHELKLGGRFVWSRQDQDVANELDGAPDPAFVPFGNEQRTFSARHSVFIQDEWTINKRWAATLGLSTAWRRVRLQESDWLSRAAYRVQSPSLHLAHKLDDEGTRKLRLSLDKSFKAPDTDQYLQRPVIHPLAPCAPVTGCGPNTPAYADRAGNPALTPEQAVGLTLGYEHYFGKTSMISVDAYQRRLTDVIGQVVALEAVPWSAHARYVIRPENLGAAWVRGLSLDTRLSASDIDPGLPRVSLRSGITLAQSRLQTVPGPDNRMADHAPWSAKLGLRYKFANLPMELSADANWRPGLWYRTAADRRLYQGRRKDLAVQASWTLNPAMKLFLGMNNLLSSDSYSIDSYGLGMAEDARISTRRPTGPTATLTLDVRL